MADKTKSGLVLTTQYEVAGYKVVKTLGIVRGNAVRARHIGRDIVASLRNIVGGEVTEYTKLLAETRVQATDRLEELAKKLDADAVVSLRYTSSTIAGGASEMLAYGTAVKLEKIS